MFYRNMSYNERTTKRQSGEHVCFLRHFSDLYGPSALIPSATMIKVLEHSMGASLPSGCITGIYTFMIVIRPFLLGK